MEESSYTFLDAKKKKDIGGNRMVEDASTGRRCDVILSRRYVRISSLFVGFHHLRKKKNESTRVGPIDGQTMFKSA